MQEVKYKQFCLKPSPSQYHQVTVLPNIRELPNRQGLGRMYWRKYQYLPCMALF